jgi:hypothetical protein
MFIHEVPSNDVVGAWCGMSARIIIGPFSVLRPHIHTDISAFIDQNITIFRAP